MSKKKISKAQIKRNRKAWVEALRSGKFKQTRNKLRSRNKAYCCLGVVCELAEVPVKWDPKDREYAYGDQEALDYRLNEDDGWSEPPLADYWDRTSATGLPLAAREWLGVTTDGPLLAQPVKVYNKVLGEWVMESSLIELNDNYGWTFGQIADAVEKIGLAE